MTLLNLCLAMPVAGFLVLLALPRERPALIRGASLLISVIVFLLSLGLAFGFDNSSSEFQFVTNVAWIKTPAIRYHVGIDGLSLWLVILSTLLTPIAVLISWNHIDRRVKEF